MELGIADVMSSHIVMTTPEFPHLPSLHLGSINLPQVCRIPRALSVLENPEFVVLKNTWGGGEFM